MLWISLAQTAVVLTIVLLQVRHLEKPAGPVFAVLGAALSFGCCPGNFVFFPQTLLLLFLALAAIPYLAQAHLPGRFVRAAFVSVALAYGVCLALAAVQYAHLLHQFPEESLADRVYPPADATTTLPDATLNFLTQIEENYGRRDYPFRTNWLRTMHEDSVTYFVNRAGFGVSRAHRDFSGMEDPPPTPQPRMATATKPSDEAGSTALSLHEESILGFATPWQFGLVRDRHRVVGFRPHQFRSEPGTVAGLRLQTVELLGLVVADRPRVYVSDHLPRMVDVASIPTRQPNEFEAAGLKVLASGEMLHWVESGSEVRALGAIRSFERCNACHEARTGDLLGAFSYTFLRAGSP